MSTILGMIGTGSGKGPRARTAIALSMAAVLMVLAASMLGAVAELAEAPADIAADVRRFVVDEWTPVFSSNASRPVTSTTLPGGVSALAIVEGDGQVNLDWEAPDSDGRAVVDYYIVYQNGEDVAHCDSTSIVISGLNNGETYRFMVAAHSPAGTGPLTTTYEATPRTAENPLSAMALVATVAAVAVIAVREARQDKHRPARTGSKRERPR